ncbi:OLC1v1000319C1 [Oldenlandia corymbosa var. corymbosa]|uniref:OLC1v1000319C1 n=1 Tax=Oldenlandia corymbosa var. corymbosa TaxID=529605 RepID=A0AAV1D307_OLDCO|nr:OLC1v1000319C1 [Oldenlandia corymbosa var. corymbosa]
MEGNISSGSMMPGGSSFGGLDMRAHHSQHPFSVHQDHHSHTRHGSMVHQTMHDNFPLTIGSMQENNQSVSLAHFNKGEKVKCVSDEDEPSHNEDADGHNDGGKGKKAFPWQRVKWTDTMVRLLITAVSYIGEETAAEYGGGARRKCANLQKKGKWKSVSKVMAERGHFVSPQQCEDKFNDLNKRYKRLNEILGRGTSCQVVENPTLLDMMDHISEKAKEEVRKILSSKHLHYEEMCSYHNGNRLHLPPDPELQRSLRLALRSRDDTDENNMKRSSQDDNDEDDQDLEVYDHDDYEENHAPHGDRIAYGASDGSSKRMKHSHGPEDISLINTLNALDCNRSLNLSSPSGLGDENQGLPEGSRSTMLQKHWISYRSVQLEEQKLVIQAQMLELEKERFQWQKFSRKKDRELEMMKVENERMKLENERMVLELKRKEMGLENS